jgi:beclin
MEEIKAAELELSTLQSEISRLEAESTTLNAEESAFWRSRNAFSLALEEFQNERDEVNIKYDHDAKLLERLQRTNVYNDAFCITHDGFFGVINGLRLGRLPNKQVSSRMSVVDSRLSGMRSMLLGDKLFFSSPQLLKN